MRDRVTRPLSAALYWGATYLLLALLWIFGRWTSKGRENIPESGGLMVVANHLSNADPPILATGILRRRVTYMAKIELFKMPLGVIIKGYGAFPVRRFESDVGALLAAERLLRRGGVLGMFPEGTRSRTGKIGTPHLGTALIALRTGATVLPCAIAGSEQLSNPWNVLKRPRISVTIGEPIVFERVKKPSEQEVREATDRIFSAITAMLPPRYLPTYTESEGAKQDAHGSDHPGE